MSERTGQRVSWTLLASLSLLALLLVPLAYRSSASAEAQAGADSGAGPNSEANSDSPMTLLPLPESARPFFVTAYYHVEPNPQLFESVEPDYFEAVSESLREMSKSLAAINVRATFCFAWLYADLVYCRNRDPVTGAVENRSAHTGIETFQRIVADGHELAYHSHPPTAIVEQPMVYYAQPDSLCGRYDTAHRHRWAGLTAGYHGGFYPGVYEFDDPADPWYGQFTWERTAESLFRIAGYLGVTVRHTNGGQIPLLDLTGKYGSGINHAHCLRQTRSIMARGFDLVSPEAVAYFAPEYTAHGPRWRDPSTSYVSYFGRAANVQLYYPDIDSGRLHRSASCNQGLTFLPVQVAGQAAWGTTGERDPRYYDANDKQGATGGGGRRWGTDSFYSSYWSEERGDPWATEAYTVTHPSLAEQFNTAIHRHLTETPMSINAWGFNHHVVNVMWADLSGLSDNWDWEIAFLRDIADGRADREANEPRPDLVQFVTMHRLSRIYDDTRRCIYLPLILRQGGA